MSILQHLFGSVNSRKLKPLRARLGGINARENFLQALSDDALRAKTDEFRARIKEGESLDSLLEEAFAVVREASVRALGMRHFDVQLMGGMVLCNGAIAEMRTGEGKTLAATLAVYLHALEGKGVHVVTVNDYLASRDAEWMGKLYGFLGMSTGVIVSGQNDPTQRRAAYQADITYGTNNEFGFDFLRDNMKYARKDMVQRGHAFAIIDEVDSILIDEARTPLIISGPVDDKTELYLAVDKLISQLTEDDFEIDEKQRTAVYSEDGTEKIEGWLQEAGVLEGNLWEPTNVSIVHHANQALRAHKLFTRDKDYIVKRIRGEDQVILIDEFTGRMMEGRRMSDGLHQAIEAKEGVPIQPENRTLASITYQNYFRMYKKLSGMTGTAMTEADEFADIYTLEVYELPTNRPIQRIDDDDVVYRTAKAKYREIIADVKDCQERGQPVLLGTASIEKSETISALLSQAGVKHEVLNARQHEREAQIIAEAGVPGAITVATNMAGRGTDIQLGGNFDMRLARTVEEQEKSFGRKLNEKEYQGLSQQISADIVKAKQEALDAGGLYVLGTERHESRRIDNQLRGRTGRQGDPGRSKFYISVEDDLMRIFAADRLDAVMRRLGIDEDEGITHRWMNKALETSQRKIEQRHFEIRKNVLKFDDVINDQRKAMFEVREVYLDDADISDHIAEMREEVVQDLIAVHMPEKAYSEQWNIQGLTDGVLHLLGLNLPIKDWASEEGVANTVMSDRILEAADKAYAEKEAQLSSAQLRQIEKQLVLEVMDKHWREHLQHIDHLRSIIHLRSYGQRDPLNEFKEEAFKLFYQMMDNSRFDTVRFLMNIQIQPARPNTQVIGGKQGALDHAASVTSD